MSPPKDKLTSTDEQDAAEILARRRSFIVSALAGLTISSQEGCKQESQQAPISSGTTPQAVVVMDGGSVLNRDTGVDVGSIQQPLPTSIDAQVTDSSRALPDTGESADVLRDGGGRDVGPRVRVRPDRHEVCLRRVPRPCLRAPPELEPCLFLLKPTLHDTDDESDV